MLLQMAKLILVMLLDQTLLEKRQKIFFDIIEPFFRNGFIGFI